MLWIAIATASGSPEATEWYEDGYKLLTSKGLEPKARGDHWLRQVWRQTVRGKWL